MQWVQTGWITMFHCRITAYSQFWTKHNRMTSKVTAELILLIRVWNICKHPRGQCYYGRLREAGKRHQLCEAAALLQSPFISPLPATHTHVNTQSSFGGFFNSPHELTDPRSNRSKSLFPFFPNVECCHVESTVLNVLTMETDLLFY